MLTIQLFGLPQLSLDGQELQVSRRKSRALVYYLAANKQAIPRQQLLALFWLDLPRPAALQTLRTTLHGLRQQLGPGLVVEGDEVALAPETWVDARLFEQALNGEPEEGTGLLAQTLALYQGEFLQGFSLPDAQGFEDWLTISREHYRRLAVRGWTTLARRHEAQQDYRQALDSLEQALQVNPLQEDLQRESIRLLYLAGDRPGAIRRYDDLRRLLDEEMGVPPMLETRKLYDAILNDRLATELTRSMPLPRRAVSQPGPKLAQAPGEIPFTGRSAELASMQGLTPPYPLVLIEGEAGVGKTRLAQEYLHTLPGLSLVGRGRELEQALPYHPVIEALRDLLARPEWPGLQAGIRQDLPPLWLAEVARLAPELSTSPAPESAIRPAEEARLWEGLRQFLTALARRQPLALLIDDLQWADVSTLGLLGYLARQTGGAPLRLLATLRPLVHRAPAMALLQALTRENRLVRLSLDRLRLGDIQAIAHQLSPLYSQPLTDWLYQNSEGNPYILVELLRYARQSEVLLPDGTLNLTAISAEPVVPQNIYTLIQSRLGRLGEAARRVFDAAVAQGREFEFEVVARAAGMSEDAALDALEELQESGLVSDVDGHWLRIDHSLTMEVAYREVGELRHRLLHRRVAEAMEGLYLNQPELVAGNPAGHLAGQLAWHFTEGNAPQRAARYALQAGAQAARLAAWSEASDFYLLALKGLSGAARLPALQSLADAYSKRGNYPRACEVLHDALVEAQAGMADPVQIELLQLALARNLMPQARYPEVIALAEQVRSSNRGESAATAELLWGTALSADGSSLEDAAEHLCLAQEYWQQNPGADPSALAQAQFERGNVVAQQGDIPQAVVFYRQALETATQVKTDYALEQRILALNNLAYHLHLLADGSTGALASAKEYAQTGLQLAQEKGVLGLQAYLYSTLGEISLAAGELDQAEAYFQEGLALAQRFSVQERVAGLTANLGLVAIRRGESALAIHRLSTALGQADALGARHLSAQVRLWLAPLLPPEQARQLLSQARAIAQEGGRWHLLEQVAKLERGL